MLRICLLCAEEDPLRCHRRLLISRTLVRRGTELRHIRGSGVIEADEEIEAKSDVKQLQLLFDRGDEALSEASVEVEAPGANPP